MPVPSRSVGDSPDALGLTRRLLVEEGASLFALEQLPAEILRMEKERRMIEIHRKRISCTFPESEVALGSLNNRSSPTAAHLFSCHGLDAADLDENSQILVKSPALQIV